MIERMNRNKQYKTVDEYFNDQPETVRQALNELKACIFQVAPESQELINYNIPAYTLIRDGKREEQIMIAGYEKHVGLYPHPTTIEHFDKQLCEYKKGKGSVQFPLDKPLPINLIKRMIKYRLGLLKT